MKNEILRRLRHESANVLPDRLPNFYTVLNAQLAFARETFFSHPLIIRCREDVVPFLHDDFGHGVDHAKKVAIEACTLVLAEAEPLGMATARRLGLLAMLAGLIHDTCRLEGDHAIRGGELALLLLHDYPLQDAEKDSIAKAIACHEAFSQHKIFDDPHTQLVSDALYDADKFRWGPDNFLTTLWEICNYQEWTLNEILAKFPQGLEMIASVQDTFRTSTGRIYGPEFIELGLTMGKKMYQIIQTFCQQHGGSSLDLP